MSEVRNEGSFPSFIDPIAPLRDALRGRYEFDRQIGQGAFATVYLARDLKHERKVAIKVLNADPTSETGEIRFIREIRLVARLQHPNILPLHDSGHVEALLYYVMPFVEGETLRLRMHRERQMAVESACAIARETADALAYAHKQGIVHRDIKPENILLSGGHAVVADFGIARAIDVGGVRQLTATGVAGPGTPAYMSPEQLLGDRAVDARSDIYSLGCVLYEMLAGKTPFPGKDGFVKRFTEPPAHISSLRRDAPPWLDTVIAKALSKDPGDRYATAADMVAALYQPTGASRTPGRDTPLKNALASPPLFEADPLEANELAAAFPDSYPSGGGKPTVTPDSVTGNRWTRRWLAAARANPVMSGISGAAIVGIGITLAVASQAGPLPELFGARPALDSTRFVVLASTGVAGSAGGTASRIADGVYDAFTRWEGFPVVSDTRVSRAIADGAPPPATEDAAIDLARRLGAGKVVWVEASGAAQSPRLRIHLYDASSAGTLDEFALASEERGEDFYATTAKRLVGFGSRPAAADGCDSGTRSFRAWTACSRAHVALANWDVRAATRAFGEAVSGDGSFAHARVWLSQLLLWTLPDSAEWRAHAIRSMQGLSGLTQRDSSVAVATAALAADDFSAACRAYARLRDNEPRSFLGWFGLGKCHRLDTRVIRDSRSMSGWSFRGSTHTALAMYQRAIQLEPRAHTLLTYDEALALLPISASVTRPGVAADSSQFAAFPSLESDTLAFVPYPISRFAALPPAATLTHHAALQRNSDLLLAFARDWTRNVPRSADAYEALADIHEARGEVAGAVSPGQSALGAVRQALELADSDFQRLRLSTRAVRLRVKRLEFARASAMADSLLSHYRSPDADEAAELIGLAAMTGRVRQTASLARRGGWDLPATSVRIPPPLLDAAADLYAHAALGACGRAGADLLSSLERQLRSYVAETHRDAVKSVLFTRPSSMLVPCTNGQSALGIEAPQDRLYRMQRAYARRDFRTVKLMLDSLAQIRRRARPGDLTIDYTYHEAWLKAAMGDTASAIGQLDLALDALPTLSGSSLKEAGAAAALGRAMALRAELASGQNDPRAARQWASAVAALWNKADEPLQPTLVRMRQLADQRR